jgi:hypothetical protein
MEQKAASQRDRESTLAILQGKVATQDFDVFLCHHGQDKPAVKQIGEQLKLHGILPWLDEWELRPGLPWQRRLEEQISQIKTVAVFVGNSGVGPWEHQELDAFLREFVRRSCPVIPVLLPGAPQEPALPVFLKAMTWVDFRIQEPDPMQRLLWGITGKRKEGGGIEAIPGLPQKTPTLFERFTRREVLLRLAGGTAVLAMFGGAYPCYRWIHPPPSSPVSSPFYIYKDVNAQENHFVPSGFMGDYDAIKLTEKWRENPYSGKTCIRVDYNGTAPQNNNWAGVYWQDPRNNWGWALWQTGYNLSKLSQLSFWVRGNTGNEQIQFFVGGISGFYGDSLQPAVYAESGDTNWITLTTSWQQIIINLKGKDLTHIIGGFGLSTNNDFTPQGVTFYLDDIIFT